jgi:nucleoside-diphosphate-sugar epimerase
MVDTKQKISILGCGWLGLPLATHLLEKEFFVNGSTTSEDKMTLLKAKNIFPFLIDIDSLISDFSFYNVDILIIAITSKNSESFENLISKIENSTINKVIFISSTSVYGESETPITEEHQTLKTPLVLIEQLFLSNQNFKTTVIRFGGLFGDQRQPGNFFKNGKKISNPEGVVNMIHQEDCIAIITQIIEKKCWNQVYNACANSHPTRREFYTKSKRNLGFDSPVFEENSTIQLKRISSEKLIKALNYTFIHSDLLDI